MTLNLTDETRELLGRIKDEIVEKQSEGYTVDSIALTQEDYDTFRKALGLKTEKKESKWGIKMLGHKIILSPNATKSYVNIDQKAEKKDFTIGK